MTGRDVHREWRDGMLAQGRKVSAERMDWETLSEQDKALDNRIAERLTPPPGDGGLREAVGMIEKLAEEYDERPDSPTRNGNTAGRLRLLSEKVAALGRPAQTKGGK